MIDQARALAKINGSSWQDIFGAVWHLFKNRYLCNYYGLSVAPFCCSHGTFGKSLFEKQMKYVEMKFAA